MTIRNITFAFLLLVLCPSTLFSQNDGSSQSRGSKGNLKKGLARIKNYLDESPGKGIDTTYILVPEKPWSVAVNTNLHHASMTLDSFWDLDGEKYIMGMKTDNGVQTSVGFKVNYRDTGIGFSKVIGKKKGSNFSFSTATNKYGINISLDSYKSGYPEIRFKETIDGQTEEEKGKDDLETPIKVKTQFIDAYYIFNNKHFSYLATNNPANIQLKSAGSFLAGMMYYHSKVDYISDDLKNVMLTFLMHNIGKQTVTQVSVGAGYAYNWVPFKGWLVSAMCMPMLTLYNKAKLYRYSSDVFEYFDDLPEDYIGKCDYWPIGKERTTNRMLINFDSRMTISYNYKNYILMAQGQYHHFRYGKNEYKGRTSEWNANISLGYRF